MARLDDPQAQADLVTAMTSGMTRAQAAASVGISRQALTAYCTRNEDFRMQLAVASRRAKLAAHNGPRLPARVTRTAQAGAMLEGDHDELDASDPDAFLTLLSRHANDGESKGCAKALDILDRWHNAEHYLALQAKAKREAAQLEQASDDQRPVVIRHGRTNLTVVDAEILDDRTDAPRG